MPDIDMVINIKVVANARKNEIKKENGNYKVYLTAPAIEGKANKLLIGVLSEYLNVKKNKIFIVKGEKSKHKIIEIIT